MHRREVIAQSILETKSLLARYLPGFDDGNCTRQAPGLPNHVAWNLGHLALVMHRAAEKFDGLPLSERGFWDSRAAASGAARSPERFDTESVCFGSVPTADASRYPGMARCVEVYNSACDRMAAAVRAADDSTLDRPVAWGPVQSPLWAIGQRMIFHNGDHTGQIACLRRALGMKSIFA